MPSNSDPPAASGAAGDPPAGTPPPEPRTSGSLAPQPGRLWLSESLLLGVALIWGLNIPIMKNGLDAFDRYWFNAVRLTLSAVILSIIAGFEFRSGRRPDPRLRTRDVLIFSVLVSIVYQFLFLLGISRTSSGNTALILSTIPMWTALSARVFLGERLRPLQWFGLIVAFSGTMVVTLQNPASEFSAETRYLAGNLLTLGAALAWSAGTVYSRPLLSKISPTQLSACGAVIGLPFHLVIAVVLAGTDHMVPQTVSLWLVIIYSGVFSTGLALPMWNYGVRHSGAAQAAVFQNLVPVIAIIAAWFWRSEAASLGQIIGGVMIVAGLLIIRRGR